MTHTITDAEIEKLRDVLHLDAEFFTAEGMPISKKTCLDAIAILDSIATQSKQAEQEAVSEAIEYLAGMGSFDTVAKQLSMAAKQAMKKAPLP